MTKLPFHADHIGSLIRPSHVSDCQRLFDEGQATAAELRLVQQAAIKETVNKQQANGIRALSSGEFDRKYYFSGFFEKLAGFREVSPVPWELTRLSAPPITALKKTGQQYPMAAVCEGKIRYDSSPYLENWRLLRDAVPQEQWGECKFTMPPACYFHLRLAPGQCYSADAYSCDEDFFADLAVAYQKEIQTLYDEGLRNLQIDDPTMAYFCSEEMRESLRKEGVDPDQLFDLYLNVHNDCIAHRPEGLHVGLHICRGKWPCNFSKSVHFSKGSYEKIAERLFTVLNYDTFFLEYDNARSGGFEPLRFLPRNKNVVLGVVTTKDPSLEDPGEMRRRVLEAASIIADGQQRSVEEAMENIGISPQCGFASVSVGAEGMTEDRMFAKLRLVRDVAKDLWP
ncbi:methionine synthase ii cobalamin-independent [Trichoderma cornu-damae]|uniref:Methionine synthase ii cobalamin-independent n=1 Tax=Trichoderma cornu-damae TaxID=654480 RepID=A0A9P8TV24_9HYPO|nr:methionine synthase ii cobalamin-independent [Trichoderma cornu-damae]